MDINDFICGYLEYVKEIHTDCCDYPLYRCKKTKKTFDVFHDKCSTCKYDTTNNEELKECQQEMISITNPMKRYMS